MWQIGMTMMLTICIDFQQRNFIRANVFLSRTGIHMVWNFANVWPHCDWNLSSIVHLLMEQLPWRQFNRSIFINFPVKNIPMNFSFSILVLHQNCNMITVMYRFLAKYLKKRRRILYIFV